MNTAKSTAKAVLPKIGGEQRSSVGNGGQTAVAQSIGAARRRVEGAGRLVKFVGQVFRELPTALRLYPSEVFRHAGTLIISNSLVVLFMTFMVGLLIGLVVHFLFLPIGIESYIGAAFPVGTMRGITEVVFGWIIAAKVGCGIVAEIGAMKISDEIDAMEVMGIRSSAYLVGTRVIAGAIVFPLLWMTGISMTYVGGGLMNEALSTSSEGAFVYYLFLFQNVSDFVSALIWGTLVALMIIVIAGYYGMTAQGGPVGVGRNTATSMLVNMVMISITALMLVQLFWGNNPNAPIAN